MLSISQIASLFKGNARSKTIQTADLRAAFGSMKSPWGSISLATSGTTTLTNAGQWYKLEGVTTTNNDGYLTSMPSDGRLVYTGDSPRHFHIAVSVSFYKSGGVSEEINIAVGLNDTPQEETTISRTVTNSNNVGATALHADFMMSNGDYIELFARNESVGSTDFILDKMYMFMVGMIV